MAPPGDPLIGALHARAAYVPLAEQLDLFGGFVGAWDLEWRGKDNQGRDVVVRGELHVGWILDGRAIQDTWRVPIDPADARRMRAFHGTTIRFYDPAIAAWRSTWLDPLNGRVRRFVGRRIDGEILLEGLDEDPRERWHFREITAESFHWVGEESRDGGHTWQIVDQMLARRRQQASCTP
jgi:hypothetical protein